MSFDDVALTKSAKVLTLFSSPEFQVEPHVIWFWQPEETALTQALTWQDWEDMGKPEAITVTVEPGDSLNS